VGDVRFAVTEYLVIGDVSVRVRALDARVQPVLEGVSRYLHAVEHSAGECADLAIDLVKPAVLSEPPADAHRLGTFDNGFTLWRSEGAVLLIGDGCVARLDSQGGRGTIEIAFDAQDPTSRWVACAVVLESLSILLHRHGLFSMHAAALARGGRGLVVAAAADSGKSTLTFRLVQSGWHYLSDDTILLRPTPDGVMVLGLRSHFSLDPEAEDLFPGLAAGREASLLKEEKWAVNVEALYPEQRIAVCRPNVLLFPTIVDEAESQVVPTSNAEAIGALLAQSSLARVKLDHAAEHIDVLGQLVRGTEAYRLYAGRDLLDDPARADALIAPLLGGTF
jgi:hypothetical protein